MIKKTGFLLLTALLLLIPSSVKGQTNPPFCIEEEDGSPSICFPVPLKVTNGTLTDNADGTASLVTGAGGGAGGWTDDGSTVRLSTSGDNVGIGTTTANNKLTIVGSFDVDTNVGIGTTAPRAALEIGSGGTLDNVGANDVYIQNDLEVDGEIFINNIAIGTTHPINITIVKPNDITGNDKLELWQELEGIARSIANLWADSDTDDVSISLYRVGGTVNSVNWDDITEIEPLYINDDDIGTSINWYRTYVNSGINWADINPYDRIFSNWLSGDPNMVHIGINWD